MLDKKFILENADLVQTNCDARGVEANVARFVELETERRKLLTETEDLNRQANEVSKSIGKSKDNAEREARKEEGRRLREAKDAKQAEVDRLAADADKIQNGIPNLSHPDAPRGGGWRPPDPDARWRVGRWARLAGGLSLP